MAFTHEHRNLSRPSRYAGTLKGKRYVVAEDLADVAAVVRELRAEVDARAEGRFAQRLLSTVVAS